MASSASKTGTDTPTFSYAQAAKGLVDTSPNQLDEKQNQSPPTSTETKSGETSSNSADSEILNRTSSSTNIQDSPLATEASDISSKGQSVADSDITASQNILSGGSSPSLATASTMTLPKEDELSTVPNGSSDNAWDKKSETSIPTENVDETLEETKEKTTETTSEKHDEVPKELKAAPIPTINIWQQRREAQEAKAKANALLKPVTTPTSKGSTTGPTSQPGSDTRPENPKWGSRRKTTETVNDSSSVNVRDRKRTVDGGPRKGAARSNRPMATDSEAAESLPPVADTSSWPTPQIAQGEDLRKVQKSEKIEKPDKEKPASSRYHGKEKWMPVPYVPTAVFNTPLPHAARRGGRAARGSREGGPRGGTNVNTGAGGDRASTSSAANAGGSKQFPSAERDRSEDCSTKEPSKSTDSRIMNNVGNTESGRNLQNPRSNDARRDPKPSHDIEQAHSTDANHHSHPSSSHYVPRNRQDSKSLAKMPEFSSLPAHRNIDHTSRQANLPLDNHGRYTINHDRRFETGPRSADVYKEQNTLSSREFPRDRDYQRGDFYRERGEPRSERGRGGYRGRGGHSNYGSTQTNQFHTAPVGQHPFPPPKGFNFSERHRLHQSNQSGSQQHASNTRANIRSPSMPTPGMYNPAPYPIQTDVNTMYGYPPTHQGPMTAVPFQPYLEQFSLMSMISMQLEYYFSVDNLCKDLFLRKHMDSQGFVLLSVIASFKRIKSLTEDMDLLRFVCRQVRNVEYRPAPDGLDRLRKGEKWEQWVLSMDMRDPSAQNDGPAPTTATDGINEGPITAAQQDGYTPFTNGDTQDVSLPPVSADPSSLDITNTGVPKRSAKLSSTAPEFSPFVPTTDQQNGANGGSNIDNNIFPDNQVENLVLVVRKPGIPSLTRSLFRDPSFRSFSNGFVDCSKAAGRPMNPKCRSFFASSEPQFTSKSLEVDQQSETIDSSKHSPGNNDAPIFWVKDQDVLLQSLSTDVVHESYNVFRRGALDKRISATSEDDNEEMDILYQFWSHFLVRNFNSNMYHEFRCLAFDDFYSRNCNVGIKHLIKFYDGVFSSHWVPPGGVVQDLVDLMKSEVDGNERKMFQRLHYIWNNGAFNLKTKKTLDDIPNDYLKVDLEK